MARVKRDKRFDPSISTEKVVELGVSRRESKTFDPIFQCISCLRPLPEGKYRIFSPRRLDNGRTCRICDRCYRVGLDSRAFVTQKLRGFIILAQTYIKREVTWRR